MKRIGLIGHPVGHSVSPAFQNAALAAGDVAARYEAIDTPPAQLPTVVAALRSPDWLGANVTVPHKEAVARLVDEVDDVARQVGAVNTVVNQNGRLFATNTDVAGFLRSIEAAAFRPAGARCLVLGAGGAARAVVFGLARGDARIVVTGRTESRAAALVESVRRAVPGADLRLVRWDAEALTSEGAVSDLIVNTTSLGMLHGPDESASPVGPAAFRAGQLAVDLVYNPPETPFLRMAAGTGARPVGGLEMLVRQGAASFELWTGLTAPVDVMRRAAYEALFGAIQ